MFGNDITIPHLLIFFPLIAGLITFFIRKDASVKAWSLFSTIITLLISFAGLYYRNNPALSGLTFNYEWLKYIGASFSVSFDGMGRLLSFLTAFAFPVILVASYQNQYKNSKAFYGLLLLSQAGLMGVFLSTDALLFYFFWELALIPVYFLCSRWGGEKRIAANRCYPTFGS
jgi:NADH-quinone oxidoreductase subunit M